MIIKTPMILSDLEKLVTDYTSKDHSSQGFNFKSSEFDFEWEVSKLNWYFYFGREDASLYAAYFHIVRDYAYFVIEFPFYYGNEFCSEDSDRFKEVGLEFSFRNGWMKLSTIITEETDLTKVFDVLFSVLKDYS
jgi:hypothetical protein